MKKLFLKFTSVALLVFAPHVHTSEVISCDDAVVNKDVRIVLAKAVEEKNGLFVGIFEMENLGIEPSLSLAGELTRLGFEAEYPDVSIEFKDLNSRWVPLDRTPGTFVQGRDHLLVLPKSKKMFRAPLVSTNIAINGTEFRLVVRVTKPGLCFVSRPFVVLPLRKKVIGFQSMFVPPKALSNGKSVSN
jgi:hypothetical protein